ncbi:MAG: hypothetical protein JW892_06185 [Anaerolineae bacterium]|nr:hypothetical protein [Anaerolineae bacterium]
MRTFLNRLKYWSARLLTLLVLLLMLTGESPGTQDQIVRLKQLSGSLRFNFITWEIKALARKAAYGLFAPQRFMDDEDRAALVLTYLGHVAEAQSLNAAIERNYINPEISDPAQATAEQRAALTALRQRIQAEAPLAEAILGEQVSQVLAEGGFGLLAQISPPVSGTYTPLPYLLIVSPRSRIETMLQVELVAGLDAEQQQGLESRIESAETDLSTLVTGIGGLSAYPAMLLETSNLEWAADVIAHEWTHHYLMRAPLGWLYTQSEDARTINETAASLLGEWAGQEVLRRFYTAFLEQEKALPEPLILPPRDDDAPLEAFDYRAVMRETRVTADQLLEEQRIEEAEAYMEERRQYLVAQGYRIRRLNQAYFAFHGAYASQPGATGEDLTGPAVRRLWAISASPGDFIRRIGWATTTEAVETLTTRVAKRAGGRAPLNWRALPAPGQKPGHRSAHNSSELMEMEIYAGCATRLSTLWYNRSSMHSKSNNLAGLCAWSNDKNRGNFA